MRLARTSTNSSQLRQPCQAGLALPPQEQPEGSVKTPKPYTTLPSSMLSGAPLGLLHPPRDASPQPDRFRHPWAPPPHPPPFPPAIPTPFPSHPPSLTCPWKPAPCHLPVQILPAFKAQLLEKFGLRCFKPPLASSLSAPHLRSAAAGSSVHFPAPPHCQPSPPYCRLSSPR